MNVIHIILDGEGVWPDLPDKKVHHLTDGTKFQIAHQR